MKLQKGRLTCRIDVGLVAVEGTTEGGAVVPSPALYEDVVIAGYAGHSCPREQKIRDGGMTGIVRPRKGGPRNQMLNEYGLERVRGHEMLG